MSFKTVLFVCAQALLIQSIYAQCIGAYGPYDGLAYDGFAGCAGPYGLGPASLAASHGPGLAVTSASPIIPVGVSVVSENGYEGVLAAGGAVPFVGTVAVEGALPTIGAGATTYGCGSGAVTITAEDLAAYGFIDMAEPVGYGYGLGPIGYGAGYAGLTEPFGYGYGLAGPLGYGAGRGCGAIY